MNILLLLTLFSITSIGGGMIVPGTIFFNFMPKVKLHRNGIILGVIGVITLLLSSLGSVWFASLANLNMTITIIVVAIISLIMLILPAMLSSMARNQAFLKEEGC